MASLRVVSHSCSGGMPSANDRRGKWRGQTVAVKKFDEESLAFNDNEFRSEVALSSITGVLKTSSWHVYDRPGVSA